MANVKSHYVGTGKYDIPKIDNGDCSGRFTSHARACSVFLEVTGVYFATRVCTVMALGICGE